MKIRFLIVVFLFFRLFQLNGQIAKEMARINADSLQQILPALTGTEKIDGLNKIAFKLCYKFPDSCISMANQTIRLSKSIDYKKGEAIGYFNLGNGYFFEDTLKLSVLNYLNALRIFDSIDPCIEMAYTYQVLAYLNWRAGRMEKSLQYTRYEIGISNQLSDYHYKCGSMTQASVYLTESFHFDSANIYLDSAIAIAESLHDTLLLTNAFFYKGYNAIKRYEYKFNEEDLIYCRECIDWNLK
ncbi:MAG: hypothetical protein JW861_10325, partial [Bacteroidales bacterium]|nr:hypothetical protein [Bacteroidales bacterium]